MAHRFSRALLLSASALSAGCGSDSKDSPPDPKAVAETATTATPSAPAPSASGATVKNAPPKPIPVFELKRAFESELTGHAGIYSVGKDLMVTSQYRVGKVAGDKIEWIGKATETMAGGGDNIVMSLWGRSADEIDVVLRNTNGRIGTAVYEPVTGKGFASVFGVGGAYGTVNGHAWIGDTLVIHGKDWEGPRIVTGRGKPIERWVIPAGSVGCDAQSYQVQGAILTWSFGGARNGMLVAAGTHCKDDKPTLEVWQPDEKKPTLVALDQWLDKDARFDEIVPNGPDGVWILPYKSKKILDYRQGKVTVAHEIEGLSGAFPANDDTVLVTARREIIELKGAERAVVGKLAWPVPLHRLVRHDGTFWAAGWGTVYKLVPGKDPTVLDECKTPFVYLYDVKPDVEPWYTFPTTRKALSSFSQAKDISLVELVEGGRKLGVVVPSLEVGEAVVAHVKSTMKDEKPELLCYQPSSPKVHPIKP
jgi:hypothetical protein